ncbi:OTU protein [Yamadazyma tenuis]|uniref:Cysteine proteinase n=1 Tax=Candida tenuis (strain ATCC 10573 / BCRC 21748 / CBS 615 / JCM 9827 / NBRC 10315 / NRRL Y-1498 / VKM Y-70) TaxID=590646 RepID=G3B3C6_CANTC|nr:cysteine proteinase [Yamadazyma tenuis ATCC 10573]EGV64137.1 cysteine proteinase [Yamadazyma tenuis ATCC 10573]WEJ96227.1 OTU protein [Yamadazyma tenuis]
MTTIDYDLAEISYDELVRQHKTQKKQLTAQITGIKKQMTKKNKKELQSQINSLNSQLNSSHQQQLHQWNALHPDHTDESPMSSDTLAHQLSLVTIESESEYTPVVSEATKPKRRNRQKERLAKRDAQIEEIRNQALQESQHSTDFRHAEMEKMNFKLSQRNLSVNEVLPDGNCLFRSIQHQLTVCLKLHKTIEELRQEAASYIRLHPVSFEPFLFNKDEIMSLSDYCTQLESTTMWGSDIEIMAFSEIYECTIEVFVAEGDNLVFGEQFSDQPRLYLAFYKHNYGLGEHYNSLHQD